jgi:hypothetical protein
MEHRSKQIPARRYLALLVALTLLDASTASSAEPEGSRAGRQSVTVTTSLVTPFFGAYELEATILASNTFGLLFNTSYLSLSNGDWKTSTGTLGAGVNYYFLGSALRGWYVEAVGELMVSSWRHQPSREVAPIVLGYTGIAVLGYQLAWDCGFVLDVGAGLVALHFPSAQVELAGSAVASGALTRLYPAIKLNVGWGF